MKKIFTIMFAVLFSVSLFAQNDLQSQLSSLSGDAAKKYLAPISSSFGANLNSGWVHKAPSAKLFGLDIEIGVVAMATMFGNEQKTFESSGNFRFNRSQAGILVDNAGITNSTVRDFLIEEIIKRDFAVKIAGPTIVGSKNDFVNVEFQGATFTHPLLGSYTIPSKEIETAATGFLDELPAAPLGAPQVTIGTVYGTMASFRYLPSVEVDKDLGKFEYFGFGIQHNPSAWLPIPLPIDVSLAYFTQSMKVGDIFDASATSFGIYASKRFGPGALNITPYAGFAMESSEIKIKYDYIVDYPVPGTVLPVKFNLKGENSSRFVIGAALKLAFLNLNVDYSFAKYKTISGGLAFII